MTSPMAAGRVNTQLSADTIASVQLGGEDMLLLLHVFLFILQPKVRKLLQLFEKRRFK